jgi:hypothetical protein
MEAVKEKKMEALGLAFLGMLLVPFILFVTILFDLLLAYPLMWAWNYVVPGLFNLHTLTYWQAFSLLIVANMLIKGSSSSTSSKS